MKIKGGWFLDNLNHNTLLGIIQYLGFVFFYAGHFACFSKHFKYPSFPWRREAYIWKSSRRIASELFYSAFPLHVLSKIVQYCISSNPQLSGSYGLGLCLGAEGPSSILDSESTLFIEAKKRSTFFYTAGKNGNVLFFKRANQCSSGPGLNWQYQPYKRPNSIWSNAAHIQPALSP